MPDTFVKIATVSVGSGGSSSIDFTSIPGGYTDLLLVHSLRSSGSVAVDNVVLKLNGSTTSISNRFIYGNPPVNNAVSSTNAYYGGIITGSNGTSNTFGNTSIYFTNYAGSANKSFSMDSVNENNSVEVYPFLTAGLWSNTSAITSIGLTAGGGNFVQYSTATLYGISNS
jgi:hypothetical protein